MVKQNDFSFCTKKTRTLSVTMRMIQLQPEQDCTAILVQFSVMIKYEKW